MVKVRRMWFDCIHKNCPGASCMASVPGKIWYCAAYNCANCENKERDCKGCAMPKERRGI